MDPEANNKGPPGPLEVRRKQDVQLATAMLNKVYPDKLVVDKSEMGRDFHNAALGVLVKHKQFPIAKIDVRDLEVCEEVTLTLDNWLHKHSSLIVVYFKYVFGCNDFITKITFCADDQHKGFSYYQRHNQPPDVTKVVEAFCELAPAYLKVGINAALGCTAIVGPQTPC